MKRYVVKTNSLTKSYRTFFALHDVSITMESGKIYGLIGQNGAGKTTLMRLLAGLSFPTKGNIELFGHRGERALQDERKRLGCMIENPGFVPYMTAKENLKFHRIMRGVPNKEIEGELLELVGLADTGNKKAKNFSLGMKQRLGIAIALLGNPELLILDEPINGLDPLGVVEIRNLLKKLCEERQMTILISSHNLPELYQTVTNYIIIHKGEIKQTLTLEQLDENCKHHIHISCDQPEKLTSVLEMQLNTTNFKVMPDKTVKLYDYWNETDLVAKTLYENGIVVSKFSIEGDTLENYFISVIGGGQDA
ncbi:ABC-2 type transport system ATP-binding protein [Paenibacillus uliginis N3/975]|uniref:ABC-2 type transport system ATP-binding protein n=1 Tax=Paenibacillus uliginis N3/975 TaxID=1313296 RepID=A0A1X7G4C8_9BACL|nr:ABC transporter ATP-binding protein [Paenibacillus uliginis]SMF63766.1 ABC-2 type transport system ATP-binding protein [Paenibacillus uliginis N3/975]